MRLGLESLNDAPLDDEERREIFQVKRKIVLDLVVKVKIGKNREMNVELKVNLPSLLNHQPERGQLKQAGTCTRIPDLTALELVLVEI